MKVLMTADTVGGVWTYAMELVRALEPFGHEVILATMGAPANAEQRVGASACQNLELVESTFKLEWMRDPWSDVDRAGDWLLDLEAKHNPGVVHLNGYAHGALPWKAPLLITGHSCVLSWLAAVRGTTTSGEVPAEWNEYARRATAGLKHADLVVAPTRAMLNSLDAHYGPLRTTQVIFNGRQSQRYEPADKEPLILSAGRLWDPAKNIELLTHVADRLPWPVAVAGNLESPDGEVANLPTSVRCLGQLNTASLAQWMARASIYALPARYEPFGLSAVEAALCGCALVLGDIPSLNELWSDTALFVSPDNEEQLVSTVRALCDDPPRLRALGKHARARAIELTPQRMARQYSEAYESLAASPNGTRLEASACAS